MSYSDKQKADIVIRALMMLVHLAEKHGGTKGHICPHCLKDYTEVSSKVTAV